VGLAVVQPALSKSKMREINLENIPHFRRAQSWQRSRYRPFQHQTGENCHVLLAQLASAPDAGLLLSPVGPFD
jgi:hypothetical protein